MSKKGLSELQDMWTDAARYYVKATNDDFSADKEEYLGVMLGRNYEPAIIDLRQAHNVFAKVASEVVGGVHLALTLSEAKVKRLEKKKAKLIQSIALIKTQHVGRDREDLLMRYNAVLDRLNAAHAIEQAKIKRLQLSVMETRTLASVFTLHADPVLTRTPPILHTERIEKATDLKLAADEINNLKHQIVESLISNKYHINLAKINKVLEQLADTEVKVLYQFVRKIEQKKELNSDEASLLSRLNSKKSNHGSVANFIKDLEQYMSRAQVKPR